MEEKSHRPESWRSNGYHEVSSGALSLRPLSRTLLSARPKGGTDHAEKTLDDESLCRYQLRQGVEGLGLY